MTRFNTLRRLHTDESGAAYSLSVAITIPLYVATLAFVVEFLMLMLSSLALQACMTDAMHSLEAQRGFGLSQATPNSVSGEGSDGAASVLGTRVEDLGQIVKRQLVVKMLPFSTTATTSTTDSSLKDPQASGFTDTDYSVYLACLEASGVNPSQYRRFQEKAAYLERALQVSVERTAASTYRIQVAYDVPLRVPILNRLFESHRRLGISTKRISAEALIELEASGRVHLPYTPHSVQNWERENE